MAHLVFEHSSEVDRLRNIGLVFGLIPWSFRRGFVEKRELEADTLGLIMATNACFDPKQAKVVWERVRKVHGGAAGGDVGLFKHVCNASISSLRSLTCCTVNAANVYPRDSSLWICDWKISIEWLRVWMGRGSDWDVLLKVRRRKLWNS
jgi:hypothetical protein